MKILFFPFVLIADHFEIEVLIVVQTLYPSVFQLFQAFVCFFQFFQRASDFLWPNL